MMIKFNIYLLKNIVIINPKDYINYFVVNNEISSGIFNDPSVEIQQVLKKWYR